MVYQRPGLEPLHFKIYMASKGVLRYFIQWGSDWAGVPVSGSASKGGEGLMLLLGSRGQCGIYTWPLLQVNSNECARGKKYKIWLHRKVIRESKTLNRIKMLDPAFTKCALAHGCITAFLRACAKQGSGSALLTFIGLYYSRIKRGHHLYGQCVFFIKHNTSRQTY